MKDLLAIFEENGSRPYLVENETGRELSYARTARAALDLAAWLGERGIARGDRLALFMPNSLELAVTYVACLFSGVVAVPINGKYGESDREYLLDISRAKGVLCMKQTRGLVPTTASNVLVASREPEDGAWTAPEDGQDIQLPPVNYDALFSITFTSGTTGRPKGICHTARTLLTNADGFNRALGITPNHRFYHVMPMTYMAGMLNNLLCPLQAGACVVIDREFDARMALDFWSSPARNGVNCMWISPSVLSLLLRMDRGALGETHCRKHMRFIASCTAPLPLEVKREFEARFQCPVLPSFGLSETLINTIDRPATRCGDESCGCAVPTVDFRVFGEDGAECGPGRTGEIMVRSDGQMLGYLAPETGEPDILPRDHWFPTGDMGHMDESGCVFITDRKKDLIIRGGINLSPKKIEAVLIGHPAIEEAAAVGLPDPVQGERVVAALRWKNGAASEEACVIKELKKACGERLEPMAIPERFVFLDDFPRSATGKVQKKALRKALAQTAQKR